jgi:hypothetical protein
LVGVLFIAVAANIKDETSEMPLNAEEDVQMLRKMYKC